MSAKVGKIISCISEVVSDGVQHVTECLDSDSLFGITTLLQWQSEGGSFRNGLIMLWSMNQIAEKVTGDRILRYVAQGLQFSILNEARKG